MKVFGSNPIDPLNMQRKTNLHRLVVVMYIATYCVSSDVVNSSIYWSFVTLATVGYGDISPLTLPEISWTILTIVIGSILSSVIFGNMFVIIQLLGRSDVRKTDILNDLEEYMSFYMLSPSLKRHVKEYIEFFWARSRGHQSQEVLANLPLKLRLEVCSKIYSNHLSNLDIFSSFDDAFFKQLSVHGRIQVCLPRQMLINAGDIVTEFAVRKCKPLIDERHVLRNVCYVPYHECIFTKLMLILYLFGCTGTNCCVIQDQSFMALFKSIQKMGCRSNCYCQGLWAISGLTVFCRPLRPAFRLHGLWQQNIVTYLYSAAKC